jgi:hypothetical protein
VSDPAGQTGGGESAAGAIRSVEISPISHRREIGGVIRVIAAVLVCAWLYAESRPADTEGVRGLLTYQTLMVDLASPDQLFFRELQEGLLEAERLRSTTGRWPEPATLEADGIPPFARDLTTKGATYTWTRIVQGTTVNYLGVPAALASEAWLLLVQEPEPGSPPDQAPDDEEHQRLADGMVLHVSVWRHVEGGSVPLALTPLPQARGWTQVVGRAPTASLR